MKSNSLIPSWAVPGSVVLLGLLLLAPASRGAASAPTFEEAWQAYEKAAAEPPAASAQSTASQADLIKAMSARSRLLTRQAWDIFESYPTDPRRWKAAVEIIGIIHGYVYDVVGDLQKDGPNALKRDVAARDAWSAYARALYEQMIAATDVPPDIVKGGLRAYFKRVAMNPASKSEDYRAVIDEFAKRFPEDPELAELERMDYMVLQERLKDPAAAADQLQRMLRSPNTSVREVAEGISRLEASKATPLQMKFTALDGREVDLEKLRGKVVLIDFWATWCGPCIEELPNVQAVYKTYHAKGFEVIGISLDSAKDQQKLIDFCRERDLPWPQHFDGRGWKNEIAVKYSIGRVPAMLLLDQSGKVVATDARGGKLESEVRRLLRL